MSDKIELHSKVVAAWNSYADEYNQWPSLGEDEKVEYAYQLGYRAAIEDAVRVCVMKVDALGHDEGTQAYACATDIRHLGGE